MAIKVVKVDLERVEGRIDERFAASFSSVEAAERLLALWARTAPDDGTYDRTDFLVTFEDGETYGGRIDLQRQHEEGYSILGHIRDEVAFYAGVARPAHMTEKEYAAFLASFGAGVQAAAKKTLDKYFG